MAEEQSQFSNDKDECQKRIDTLIRTLKGHSNLHSNGMISTEELNVREVGAVAQELYEMLGLRKDYEEGKELTIRPESKESLLAMMKES
jgi:hypothetical protein